MKDTERPPQRDRLAIPLLKRQQKNFWVADRMAKSLSSLRRDRAAQACRLRQTLQGRPICPVFLAKPRRRFRGQDLEDKQ